jgi:hypothetical protein
MIDWKTALLDPNYNTFGVPAVLVIAETDVAYGDLTVIDKTSGEDVGGGSGEFSVTTIKPACAIRVADLTSNGIDLAKLKGSMIAFNGKSWRIEYRIPRPVPNGEDDGEMLLILTEVNENDV